MSRHPEKSNIVEAKKDRQSIRQTVRKTGGQPERLSSGSVLKDYIV